MKQLTAEQTTCVSGGIVTPAMLSIIFLDQVASLIRCATTASNEESTRVSWQEKALTVLGIVGGAYIAFNFATSFSNIADTDVILA